VSSTGERWAELAGYNARKAQGIVHTPEYAKRMAAEQAIFDTLEAERMRAEGYVPMGKAWVKAPIYPDPGVPDGLTREERRARRWWRRLR
jgi:hypothetical protein